MMKRVKVKVVGSGKMHDPFHVDLPNCIMDVKRDVDGKPVYVDELEEFAEDSMDYIKMECFVLVPDDEVKDGHLDQARIRAKYNNWKKFNASDVEINL